MARSQGYLFVAALLLAAGCGGGGDSPVDLLGGDSGAGSGIDTDVGAGDAGNSFEGVQDAADAMAAGVEVLPQPTVTADPGTAWMEVDGQRFEYSLANGLHVQCDVAPDYVQINIQSNEAGNLSLVVSQLTGSWTGSLTANAGDSNVSYGSGLFGGQVGIGANAVSYEGPIDKVVDYDVVNAEQMSGTIAVNCDSAGGDPTATIGGQPYTFPISGAQSFECTVEDSSFEIRVNRLSSDNLQLEMQGRDDGTRWIGAVVIYTADGSWTGQLPLDGTGLTIAGGTVTFDGMFAGPDGSAVSGSATATCY